MGPNSQALAEFTVGGPVNSALIKFTKALADRACGQGIRINTVCPGPVATDRLIRYGQPEEVARVVRFLCSEDASYIHGTNVDVDGGVTAGI